MSFLGTLNEGVTAAHPSECPHFAKTQLNYILNSEMQPESKICYNQKVLLFFPNGTHPALSDYGGKTFERLYVTADINSKAALDSGNDVAEGSMVGTEDQSTVKVGLLRERSICSLTLCIGPSNAPFIMTDAKR